MLLVKLHLLLAELLIHLLALLVALHAHLRVLLLTLHLLLHIGLGMGHACGRQAACKHKGCKPAGVSGGKMDHVCFLLLQTPSYRIRAGNPARYP
ncbi:hypothetical protein AA0616_1847 [Komagataeibacter nataicola NRIC 0616]|nr:hypothetical protein AA0616_1847 [Komagataeibacter nataicola NRIC 0616]